MYNVNVTRADHTTFNWLSKPIPSLTIIRIWAARTFDSGCTIDVVDVRGRTVESFVSPTLRTVKSVLEDDD